MQKKRRPRFLMVAFSITTMLLLALSACGAQGTPTGSTTASGTPVHGGTWVDDLYEEPSSLIPNGSSETFANLFDETIWAPLFVGAPDGTIKPGLISEMPSNANGDVSADLKTWTFKLRSGLKWSDGQPLDARDVDYTWRLWTGNSKFTASTTSGFNLIQSATVSPDNLSITFHLSQPFEPFISVWTDGLYAPIPAHIFSKMQPGDILKSSQNLHPTVTSGPFMLTEAVRGDHYTVVRNPNYYLASQGYPYLDKIVFRIVTNQDTILSDFQAGSIDSSWFLDVTKTPAYKAMTNYHIAVTPANVNFEAMYFNLNNPILKDVTVRHAMALAVDQQTLIRVARDGEAVPLCTNHGPGYKPGYQADAPCPKFDIAQANTLLEGDGWTMGPGGVRQKGGQSLVFSYITTANNPWRKADALIMQTNLKQIGVKTNIQYYPADTFFGTILPGGKPGQYDLAEFENSYPYDADDSTQFACNQIPSAANSFGGTNWDWYCNHTVDSLEIQEQSTLDPAKRQQIFNQLHQIYLTDFPFVTLYSPYDVAVVKNSTHNYLPGPTGASETINVWTWWCDGGKC